MTLDNHLTDIFNKLNKNIDKTIAATQNNDGKLVICPGGINNTKQRLKTVFGLRSQYFYGLEKKDFAANEAFQEFFENVKQRGYCLKIADIKEPINYPKKLLSRALIGAGTGALLWKVSVPFIKLTGAALMVGGAGLTCLRMSNTGKAKVTLDIYKPEI
jgi:hypothetical protein